MNLVESVRTLLTEAYGAWVSPEGKMVIVSREMEHEEEARKILGKKFKPQKKTDPDREDFGATHALTQAGWARVTFDHIRNEVQIEIERPMTSKLKMACKDYAIEHGMTCMKDTAVGWRPL